MFSMFSFLEGGEGRGGGVIDETKGTMNKTRSLSYANREHGLSASGSTLSSCLVEWLGSTKVLADFECLR